MISSGSGGLRVICRGVLLCLLGAAGWSFEPLPSAAMGGRPFSADVRSALSDETKELLASNGCLPTGDDLVATATYRDLRTRQPIAGKVITATLSFPGRDRSGSRLITISYPQTTDATGAVTFAIPLDQAVAKVKETLRKDRFYRGVRRTRGRVTLSFSSEETLQRSIRYVPATGFRFTLCS